MKAVVFRGKKNFSIEEATIPEINNNEVLVNVKSCGICGTDKHVFNGAYEVPLPIILGHEFSGIIENVGSDIKNFKAGDRVVVSPDIYCNYCDNCRKGLEKYCSNFKSLGDTVNGAFAEYVAVPLQNLHKLPTKISYEHATLIEPATCVYSGIKIVEDYSDKKVIILGAGVTGLIYLSLFKLKSPLLLDIMDISNSRLQFVKNSKYFQVDNIHLINIDIDDYYSIMKNKYDVIIDCTGVEEVIQKSINLLNKNGYYIMFGVTPKNSKIVLNPFDIYDSSWKIFGSRPDMRAFSNIIELIEQDKLDLEKIISHRFKLDEFLKGFDLFMNSPSRRKVVINI